MTTATPRSGPKPAPPPGRPAPAQAAVTPRVESVAGDRYDNVPMTGAQSLVRSLEEIGCEVVFGIPGGTILPAYDPLLDSTRVRHVLVRHEQGAGHAATGYAQATGKVGVCMATSGPGATNLVTPIADAHMDSIPVVAITGQQSRALIGTDAFQEADITGITMPITKHNMLVTDARRSRGRSRRRSTSRPRADPARCWWTSPRTSCRSRRRSAGPRSCSCPATGRRSGRTASRSARPPSSSPPRSKPVLYVGGGVLKAEASEELLRLAEQTGIPVVTTLMARGAFPDSHRQHVGMPGMHGTVAAVAAMQRSDLLIALGARFDDRVTGQLASFAPQAKIVHADIDPAEISKNRRADVPIVGDCREVILELIDAVATEQAAHPAADLTAWWAYLNDLRETYPLGYDWPADGSLSPEYVIERIGVIAGPDALYAAGVGQHQMWAAQFIRYEKPRTWLNSGGLGTMGFAVPAAMGAKMAVPDAVVWCIDGDGCFQMTNQELATCAIENIPIKVAIINNGNLGMVRQWQNLFYAERYSQTDLGTHKHRIPDFKLLAEAMGCVGLRAESREDVDRVIHEAMAINDRPVVIDFVVGADAQVWPMVAAGTGNDQIMAARDIRPLFDSDELVAGPAEIDAVIEEAQT